jgi:hypothetical protein
MVTKAVRAFADGDFAGYSPEARITAFTLNSGSGYPGVIDHGARTITVSVPASVNRTGLTADVTHTGLTLRPDPAAARDYDRPVIYTVILEDGAELPYTVRVSAEVATVAELNALLDAAPGGTDRDNPVLVTINADLTDTGGNGWADFLSAIQAKGKFVSLDLSDCTMAGMTATAGEFDPGTADTGESKIVSLVLPDTATSIKAGAAAATATFRFFTALTSAGGTGITSIGNYAFQNCTALKTVNLPEAATFGTSAFNGCTALETVRLPEATSIGASAFNGCTALTTVSLLKLATTANSIFNGCSALTAVSLPEAATIGQMTFQTCRALETISLPKVGSIGANAFQNCTALTTVDLPVAATIGTTAFNNCTALETIHLPEAASIGNSAFSGCTALETLSLPKAASIGNSVFQSTGTRALTVILGTTTAPAVGTNCFLSVTVKPVTVLVPVSATGYGAIPAAYDYTDVTTGNWGYAFRGKGWTGSAYGVGTVNGNVTLVIDYITP